jgi:hypothetical protein
LYLHEGEAPQPDTVLHMVEPDERQPVSDSDQAMLERARARHGSVGAIVFSAMLGVDKVLGRKPKDEGAVVWEASGEPEDIDADGITIDVDDQTKVVSQLGTDKVARRVRKKRTAK